MKTRSIKKRAVQNVKHSARNRAVMSRLRTFLRHNEQIITADNLLIAQKAFSQITSELHRAVRKGVLHKATATRKITRLAKRLLHN